MCGIAGYVGDRDAANAQNIVRAMVSSLARRGPDGEGVECWSRAALGHRRLSIFDLSDAGRQPMTSPDRSIAVVFNGAIYNFLDLRAELVARGFQFQSATDTEVLIHGYAFWGIDGLVARLRGMFAFGLWDDRQAKLYLVRDRLGVKPLVYRVDNGRLAFASTVRALRDAGIASEIDPQGIADYLEFGYVTDARTIFSGVSKVPAATIVEWCGGNLSERQYWMPPSVADVQPTFEEAVEHTEHLFLEAVRIRLEADVPVGALLSAGVDSSLVCWAIAKLGGNVKAFTVATPGDPADESAAAAATARAIGLDHSIVEVSADDAPDVQELVSAFGEPFACASALGMLRVSRAIKPHATVLLTGDGGDDYFLGYPEHANFFLAQRLAPWIPSGIGRRWPQWRERLPHAGVLKRAANLIDYSTGGIGAVARAHDGLPFYRERGLLGERLRGATVTQREILRSRESARHLLKDFLAFDRETRFPGEYMTKVDGGTMHYALEARAPFLDQELCGYAASLAFSTRLYRGALKAVLREVARRRLGEQVASGRKRGFTIPVGRWLAGRWRSQMEESLEDSVLAQEGWINAEAVKRELAAARDSVPNQLWYLFVLEHWLRNDSRSAPLRDSMPVAAGERSFS